MNKKTYKKKKIDSLYISITFLILSILLTLGLYIYNISLENDNLDLQNNIKIKESSIKELEKDSQIVALSLYDSNINTIKQIEDYSKITTYINHLITLRRKYNIDFKGFKYSGGELNTQVIARSDSRGINYKKVVNFIEKYRTNNDLSALFDLLFIKSITSTNDGIDNIFNINLKLKNNISQILEKAKEREKELEEIRKQKELKKKELFRIQKEKLLKQKKEKTNSGTINK